MNYTPSSQYVFNVKYLVKWEESYPMSRGLKQVWPCGPVVLILTLAACAEEPYPSSTLLWSHCFSRAQLASHADSSVHVHL